MRLLKNPYRELEKALGYRFRNRRLLRTALTHRSWRYEHDPAGEDNQRLEFLGDAVLNLIISARLYEAFPELTEGELTRRRCALTNGRTLARIGAQWNLGPFLLLGRGEQAGHGHTRPATLSDAVEAIVGAAYLDGGLKAVERLYQRWWAPLLEQSASDAVEENPKGALQEFCQRQWRVTPTYRVVEVTGPPHAQTFSVEVLVGEEVLGRGEGRNKRLAEAAAAREACRRLLPELPEKR